MYNESISKPSLSGKCFPSGEGDLVQSGQRRWRNPSESEEDPEDERGQHLCDPPGHHQPDEDRVPGPGEGAPQVILITHFPFVKHCEKSLGVPLGKPPQSW